MYSTHAAFRADCQDDLEYTVMTVRRPACLCLVGARALTEDVLAHSMVGRCSCAWRRRSSYTNQSGIGCRSSSLRRTRSTPSSSDASKGEIDGLSVSRRPLPISSVAQAGAFAVTTLSSISRRCKGLGWTTSGHSQRRSGTATPKGAQQVATTQRRWSCSRRRPRPRRGEGRGRQADL